MFFSFCLTLLSEKKKKKKKKKQQEILRQKQTQPHSRDPRLAAPSRIPRKFAKTIGIAVDHRRRPATATGLALGGFRRLKRALKRKGKITCFSKKKKKNTENLRKNHHLSTGLIVFIFLKGIFHHHHQHHHWENVSRNRCTESLQLNVERLKPLGETCRKKPWKNYGKQWKTGVFVGESPLQCNICGLF